MGEDAQHLLGNKEDDNEDLSDLIPTRHSRSLLHSQPNPFVVRHQRLVGPLFIALAAILCAAAIGFVWRLPNCIYLPHGPGSCLNSLRFECGECLANLGDGIDINREASGAVGPDWRFDPHRDSKYHSLTDAQCEAAFPGLFVDVDAAAERLHAKGESARITRQLLDDQDWRQGTVRGMIYEGELYLISNKGSGFGHRMLASLHSLNTALLTAREPPPNIEFAINDADYLAPELPYWAYTRKAEYENTWLIPDFGFYSWPEPGIGTYSEVRRRMAQVEEGMPHLSDKIPKAFWRGNVHLAEVMRRDLLKVSEGKSWSDIHTLEWGDKEDLAANYVSIEDHCKYAFLIHTEGESYSGRLKYLLNCRSLIFAHKMQWIQPFEYLMVSSGEQQNFVEVERDFSDLEEKVTYYLEHPTEAQRIIDNSVKTFRDRYLTPATTSCHWRRLIRRYAEVSDRPEFFYNGDEWRGVPFESAALMNKLHWKIH